MRKETPLPAGALGIRVDPKETAWALVSGSATAPVLEAHDKLVPPKIHKTEGERLVWYWDRTALLVTECNPAIIAIRYAETFGVQGARESDRARARVEGIIMTSAAKRGVKLYTGAFQDIGTALGIKKPKDHLDDDDLRGLDWSQLDSKRREAVFVAVAALG